MKRLLIAAGVVLAALACAAPAPATEISAKLKSKKVQGDFVPAYACSPDDPSVDCGGSLQVRSCSDGTGPCTGTAECTGGGACTAGAVTKSAAYGRHCTFEKGNYKVQVGKDAKVQILKLNCTGGPLPTQVCAHVVQYTTITDINLDTKGMPTPSSCLNPVAGEVAGTSTFAVAQRANLTCDTKGKCKGVLPLTIDDPCPTVDKIYQILRVEVFDGPAFASVDVGGGVTLQECCGRNQMLIPNLPVSDLPACQGVEQDVLATSGAVLQIK